jgi:hypothetical protein
MLLRSVTKHVTEKNKTHVIARSEATWQSRKFDAMFGDCRVVPPRNDEQLFRLMEID